MWSNCGTTKYLQKLLSLLLHVIKKEMKKGGERAIEKEINHSRAAKFIKSLRCDHTMCFLAVVLSLKAYKNDISFGCASFPVIVIHNK